MRPGRLRTRLPTDLRDSNEEARAALRQAVRAACADLAEMDQLLESAEQLVSSGFGTDRPARFTLDAIQ
jgi:tellurite resistance protein